MWQCSAWMREDREHFKEDIYQNVVQVYGTMDESELKENYEGFSGNGFIHMEQRIVYGLK